MDGEDFGFIAAEEEPEEQDLYAPDNFGFTAADPNLLNARSTIAQELEDPDVAGGLFNLTHNEVGSQGPEAQQAFIESVFNRAAARNQTLAQTISDRAYYPAQSFRERQIAPEEAARYRQMVTNAAQGSNLSRFATGNASGNVGFAGGPQTYAAGGERFGIEGPDLDKIPRARPADVQEFRVERGEAVTPVEMEVRRAKPVGPDNFGFIAERAIPSEQPQVVTPPEKAATGMFKGVRFATNEEYRKRLKEGPIFTDPSLVAEPRGGWEEFKKGFGDPAKIPLEVLETLTPAWQGGQQMWNGLHAAYDVATGKSTIDEANKKYFPESEELKDVEKKPLRERVETAARKLMDMAFVAAGMRGARPRPTPRVPAPEPGAPALPAGEPAPAPELPGGGWTRRGNVWVKVDPYGFTPAEAAQPRALPAPRRALPGEPEPIESSVTWEMVGPETQTEITNALTDRGMPPETIEGLSPGEAAVWLESTGGIRPPGIEPEVELPLMAAPAAVPPAPPPTPLVPPTIPPIGTTEQAPSLAIDQTTQMMPATNTDVEPGAEFGSGEVRRIPGETIALRPDVMQFKQTIDSRTGQTEEHQANIVGDWDDIKAGNLLLWEPSDPAQYGLAGEQKYLVANGHGRFNHGQKLGVNSFNAQILREADGVSAQEARIIAAWANIADGKGTIFDQANFIRNEAGLAGENAAVARARQIGARSRKAEAIAINAAPDLYASFINEQISPEAAAAIADAAPGNAGLQRLGIQRALAGNSPSQINNFLLAAQLEARTPQPSEAQMDLLGSDDAAIRRAEQAGERAGNLQRELDQQIQSVAGAAKRPEKARALGVDVKDPESINARLAVLRSLRERARAWHNDPPVREMVLAGELDPPQMIEKLSGPVPPGRVAESAAAYRARTPLTEKQIMQRARGIVKRMHGPPYQFGGQTFNSQVSMLEAVRSSLREREQMKLTPDLFAPKEVPFTLQGEAMLGLTPEERVAPAQAAAAAEAAKAQMRLFEPATRADVAQFVDKKGVPAENRPEAINGITRTLSLASDPRLAVLYEEPSQGVFHFPGEGLAPGAAQMAAKAAARGLSDRDRRALLRHIPERFRPRAERSARAIGAVAAGEGRLAAEQLRANENRASIVIPELVRGERPGFDLAGTVIATPSDLAMLLESVHSPWQESLKLAAVDPKSRRLLALRIVHIGTLDESIAHPRDIIRELRDIADKFPGARLYFSHNHPSGKTEPSSADVTLTNTVHEAASYAGLHVEDHLITEGGQFYSFTHEATRPVAQSRLRPWEVMRHREAPIVNSITLPEMAAAMRNGDPNAAHVFFRGTRSNLIALERVPDGTNVRAIEEAIMKGVAREGAYSVAVSLPAGGEKTEGGYKQIVGRIQRAAFYATANRAGLIDASWPGMPSAYAQGLIIEWKKTGAPTVTEAAGPAYRARRQQANFNEPDMPNVVNTARVNEANGAGKPPAGPPGSSMFGPNTPPNSNPFAVWASRYGDKLLTWWREQLPRSPEIARKIPESPVISEHQMLLESEIEYMVGFTERPWWKTFRSRTEEEIIDLEHLAVNRYRLLLAGGTDRQAAWAKAVSQMPPDVQALFQYRESRIPIEKWAAGRLDVAEPAYTGDPYIARLTNEEGKAVVDLHPQIGNWGRHIRQSIGSFDNSRIHATMKEGIARGTQYESVALATFVRELYSTRLESTARMLEKLKAEGVLFDEKADAIAAHDALQRTPVVRPARVLRPLRGARRGDLGPVTLVRGFGGRDYWARSRIEAQFLHQNLNPTHAGGMLGKMVRVANAFARNPNLQYNPLPHVTKNMAFKYVMQRVGNLTLQKYAREYATEPTRRAIFEQVMPMPKTGVRVPQLKALESGNYAQKAAAKWGKWLSANHLSARFIFAKADPAMRYGLWKAYLRKGLTPQEAANHVWIDLIRYDENSGALNFWKNIPFNFFAPWRLGTYSSLFKAMRSHPIRTMLVIGAIEYLREIMYRKLGWWTHLPVDYLDAPLAEAITDPKVIPGILTTLTMFGPGGSQGPHTLGDVMKTLHGDPGMKARVMNMFWGLTQLYNIPQEFAAYLKDGDPKHLGLIMANATMSTHSALRYHPRRLMQWLPETLPGLEKSTTVRGAEALQEKIRARTEKAQLTHEARHGIGAALEYRTEAGQLEALRRGAGIRPRQQPARPTRIIPAQPKRSRGY
jgi:hypothetical protein